MPPLRPHAQVRPIAPVVGAEEPSIGELFNRLGAETGTLVRQEMNLAAVEMTEKVSEASKHALMIGVGSSFGTVSLMTLAGALVVGLSHWMDLWMSALLVGVALALAAYAVVRMGVGALRQMSPIPKKTLETMKENKSWAQELVR